MSLYDKSSLVLIPSGTKTSKVYSQKPTNGDGDFTFSRSTAATRVNASGNIEKETQNLLVQSNSFDVSANWVNTFSSETSGQSGYDGTNNAWLLTKTDAGGRIHQNFTTSGVITYSVYLKANASNYALIQLNGSGADKYMYVDLTNGNKGSLGGGNIDENIEDVGSGWYRCSVTANTDATRVRIYPANSTGDVSATSGSIYIQDAQVNYGLVPQEVITTTTSAVYGGITDNTPRLDYTDSSCPALLLEPQRTNLLSHSEYISGYDSNTTTTFNYGESPEGFNNSIRVQVNSSGYAQKAQAKGGLTANTTYTFSFWLSSESDSADMRIYDNSNGANIINSTALAIPDSGWERVTQTFTTPAGCTSINVYCLASGGKTAGDLTITWGWQLEEGSYATSYIPTYGSSVTRVAESNSVTGVSDLIGQTEGTMYVEFEHNIVSTTEDTRFILSDNSYNNWIFFSIENGTSLRYYITSGGVNELDATATNVFPSVGRYKVALAYEDDLLTIYVNGVQKVNNTTSTNIPAMSAFLLSGKEAVTSAVELVDKQIHQALLFKTRLTNEELAALTTI